MLIRGLKFLLKRPQAMLMAGSFLIIELCSCALTGFILSEIV